MLTRGHKGYTPLCAAISGRQWGTPKLILAISAYDSDDSDDIIDKGSTFVDIAIRPSIIQSNVHPAWLLDKATIQWAVKQEDGTYTNYSGNLLQKSVHDHDFEAFVNILDLYKTAPLPIKLSHTIIKAIMHADDANMLDELIRQTGTGIDIERGQTSDSDILATNDNDSNKFYLGLSVHGKKRMDLARMNDPKANHIPVIIHPIALAGLPG